MSAAGPAELAKSKLIQWFNARDALFDAAHKQNRAIYFGPPDFPWPDPDEFYTALKRAMDCDHPDSFWLKQLFANRFPKDVREAKEIFLRSDDPRAWCFAALMISYEDDYSTLMDNAVRSGDALAIAKRAYYVLYHEKDRGSATTYAAFSASKGEREGIHMLAECLEEPLEKIDFSAYEEAAKLGEPLTCRFNTLVFSFGKPRFCWAKVLSRAREEDDFLLLIKKRLIMFEQICKRYQQAVITWIMCAKRVPGLSKDTRVIIAKLVWSCRHHDAQYDVDDSDSHSTRLAKKPQFNYAEMDDGDTSTKKRRRKKNKNE